LSLDGTDVTGDATVTDTATGATVSWVPTQTFAPGTALTLELTFSDTATPAHTETWTGTYVISPVGPGNFVIEAEDYNYGSGQHIEAASVMPYYGGAYEGLVGEVNIDYFRPGDDARTEANNYRTEEVRNVPVADNLANDSDRGGWEVTTSWRIGWVGGGHWYNYTRDFPEDTYQVWAALSHDTTNPGALSGRMDLVTGATTGNQTLTALGTFNAPGSGGWGQNNQVPMRDEAGNIAVISLGGVQTVRYTSQSGDIDYFTFVPADEVVPPPPGAQFTSASIVGNNLVLEWEGEGMLVASETVDGTYTPVAGNPSSPAQIPITGSQQFFQIRQ
jgi:hypothetical protein